MGGPLAAPAAPSSSSSSGIPAASSASSSFFLLLLAGLAALLAASEPHLRSPNATDVQRPLWKGSPEQMTPNRGPPALAKSGLEGRNGSTAAQEGVAEAEESQSRLAALLLPGTGGGERASDPEAAGMTPNGDDTLPVQYFSEKGDGERNASGLCLGCPAGEAWEATLTVQRGESGPLEALSKVTRFARPLQDGARKELDGKDGPDSQASVPEGQEEAGSGDQQGRRPPNKGSWARGTSLTPSLHVATKNGSLSHDSAETDLLLDTVGREAPAAPTESSGPHQISEQPPRGGPDQDSAQKEEPLELWVDASSHPPTLDGTDWTGLGLGTPQSAVTPLVHAGRTPKPSPDPSASEIIDIDYYDLFDGEALGEAGPPEGGQGKPPKEKGTSWSLHDLYDDFTPFDESDFYPTTSFYTDGDEEDLEEPEEEEEEEEDDEDDGGGGLERGLEDENDYRAPTLATPKIQTVALEAEPTNRHFLVPPLQTFVISGGGHSAATTRPRPAEAGRDLSLSGGSDENGTTECRSGYIRHNNSCKSVCDAFPSYCYNGGQCYLVENLGAFCRCNTQDYIWHKGMRCESIITDFQVMCVAVGSAALVVLLLFMMTVFFAKKLYLLKTENNKLRKTKYRTPSELHNDNFSLSTIAEGSHPNEDPNALHKLQDPLKSCLKEEESFNIQNSMSPKLDHGKGDLDDSEVNCLQNNLT